MSSGVYCKNIAHVELEDDGMVYCQHCYRELEAENERLRKALQEIISTQDNALSCGLKLGAGGEMQKIATKALEE